jgi:TorA maturation chaperone TorD
MNARVASGDAETRAYLYAGLANAFRSSPDADTLETIRQVADVMGIPGLPEEGDHAARDVQREYAKLFEASEAGAVPLCESAFRGGGAAEGAGPGRQAAPRRGDVHDCYAEAGILPEQQPGDHIANELGFLAFLWSREARAVPVEAIGWQDLRREFRREHLLRWIGPLSRLVSERDRLGYYRIALQAAEDLLHEEEDEESRTLAA